MLTDSAASVIESNKRAVAAASIIFSVGMGVFWVLDNPVDWDVFFINIFLSAAIIGSVLGYRCQGQNQARVTALAYPVSWRIGCIWIVLAAIVESVVTDFTVAYTLNILSPFLLVMTGWMALTFMGGWLMKKFVSGLQTLSRLEWLQVVMILLTAISIVVFALSIPQAELPSEKSDTDDSISEALPHTGPHVVRV